MKNIVRTSTISLLLGSLLVSGAMANPAVDAPVKDNLSGAVSGSTFESASRPDTAEGVSAKQQADDIQVTVEPVFGTIQQVRLQMQPQPSAGYAIDVTRIEFADGIAYIYYRVTEPAEDSFNATVITEPSTTTYVDARYEIQVVADTGTVTDPSSPVDQTFLPEPDLPELLPAPASGEVPGQEANDPGDDPEALTTSYSGTINDIIYPDEESGSASWIAKIELVTDQEDPYDRFMFFVREDTELFRAKNGDVVSATLDDLKEGQHIEVTSSGPALLSYPMQVGADAITIK